MIYLVFCTYRTFNFKLFPDTTVFSDDFKLSVNGRDRRHADMTVYYSGHAVGMFVIFSLCLSIYTVCIVYKVYVCILYMIYYITHLCERGLYLLCTVR